MAPRTDITRDHVLQQIDGYIETLSGVLDSQKPIEGIDFVSDICDQVDQLLYQYFDYSTPERNPDTLTINPFTINPFTMAPKASTKKGT